jgi:hypothetical protein
MLADSGTHKQWCTRNAAMACQPFLMACSAANWLARSANGTSARKHVLDVELYTRGLNTFRCSTREGNPGVSGSNVCAL